MKHNDKTSRSDSSARLDALLSDFLNKDIVEPVESPRLARATSTPLGDLAADNAAGANTMAAPQATAATQKVVPVNRTEVWEPTIRRARLPELKPSGLSKLAAEQLDQNGDSLLGASAASRRNLLFGSIVLVLLLLAGRSLWQSGKTTIPQGMSDEPEIGVSQAEIDAPAPDQTSMITPPAPMPHSETVEANATTSFLNGGHDQRLSVVVSVPNSSASTDTASAFSVMPAAASNAAKLRNLPAPALGHSKLTLGPVQDLSSVQPVLPPAPLPLPPDLPKSAMKDVVPDSIRTVAAIPAVPLTKVPPIYPDLARRMNVAGTVRVAIVVDTVGKVVSANAIDGPPALRSSAELAVKQWHFRPATMNGLPVTGKGTVSILFSPDRH